MFFGTNNSFARTSMNRVPAVVFGTAWTATGSLSTGRYLGGDGGTQSSGLIFGGHAALTSTEEFTAADFTINPVTTIYRFYLGSRWSISIRC